MKGIKLCPKCHKPNGARALACKSCGHEFATAKIKPHTETETTQPRQTATEAKEQLAKDYPVNQLLGGPTVLVIAPAGPCPVPWTGDMKTWLVKLQDLSNYSVFAVKYWLRNYLVPGLQARTWQIDKLVAEIDTLIGIRGF